jgi:hypothetical protein
MRKHTLILTLLAFVAQQAVADAPPAAPKSVSELSASLSSLSEACSATAADFASADHEAIFKSGEDRQLAALQIRTDTQVYGVSHGNRETTEYMVDRMKAQADSDAEASKQLAAKMEDEANQVTACITSAEDHGKALYSGFKTSRRKNQKMDEANSLMTAWLVNLKTISKQTPKGSDEARTAWQGAKAHAELDGL